MATLATSLTNPCCISYYVFNNPVKSTITVDGILSAVGAIFGDEAKVLLKKPFEVDDSGVEPIITDNGTVAEWQSFKYVFVYHIDSDFTEWHLFFSSRLRQKCQVIFFGELPLKFRKYVHELYLPMTNLEWSIIKTSIAEHEDEKAPGFISTHIMDCLTNTKHNRSSPAVEDISDEDEVYNNGNYKLMKLSYP